MLARFEVENFLSFDKKVEFSLIAGDVRTKKKHLIEDRNIKILKTAVLYGANASGKSNLVRAINFAKDIIVEGLEKVNVLNSHYRLNENNINKPTIFNFEIKAGTRYYSYGFGVILSKNQILEEWLYEISEAGEKLIFERIKDEEDVHQINFGLKLLGDAKKRFDVYKDDFKSSDNLLFLSEINRKSLNDIQQQILPLIEVYAWFDKKLTVIFPCSRFQGLSFVGDNTQMSDTFNEYLHIFQTGIKKVASKTENFDNIRIPDAIKQQIRKDVKKEFEKDNIKDNSTLLFSVNGKSFTLFQNKEGEYIIKKLGLEHESDCGKSVVFDMDEESDGTQRLLDLIPALSQIVKNDRVYVIDEIDRSLHSKLTYSLFEIFLQLSTNCESQLIATTHESLLLDLDLFRKDEIWFVEKENNSSRIYSLDEFKVRNDKAIRKDYLLGRYGAIPIFKSFKNIDTCQID
ncbi:AAA family ATPase [Odoribacter lunatus]|uniref:AAA family ATPase n=1 Tax=Odoribacter lunatus TaxID=2941335 RepID=UPI002040B359|nr:ATP-binding protein [Odoribacter lunatus]